MSTGRRVHLSSTSTLTGPTGNATLPLPRSKAAECPSLHLSLLFLGSQAHLRHPGPPGALSLHPGILPPAPQSPGFRRAWCQPPIWGRSPAPCSSTPNSEGTLSLSRSYEEGVLISWQLRQPGRRGSHRGAWLHRSPDPPALHLRGARELPERTRPWLPSAVWPERQEGKCGGGRVPDSQTRGPSGTLPLAKSGPPSLSRPTDLSWELARSFQVTVGAGLHQGHAQAPGAETSLAGARTTSGFRGGPWASTVGPALPSKQTRAVQPQRDPTPHSSSLLSLRAQLLYCF